MKIKNCPFCGSEVAIEKVPLWNGSHGYPGCYEYVISCDNCGCRKHLGNNNTVYYTDEEAKQNAIDNWNMRAIEAEPCEDEIDFVQPHKMIPVTLYLGKSCIETIENEIFALDKIRIDGDNLVDFDDVIGILRSYKEGEIHAELEM